VNGIKDMLWTILIEQAAGMAMDSMPHELVGGDAKHGAYPRLPPRRE
jgi:hypothetical protein